MSSDNQYTALGPAAIGFQTDGSRIFVGVDASGVDVGVVGNGGTGDGVVGVSGATGKSGVFGFNNQTSGGANGVFGACNSPDGVGVGGDSTVGVGMRGHSAGNDGTVGLSDATNKSGVFGFNSKVQGPCFGVAGLMQSQDGVGVLGFTNVGTGVLGQTGGNAHAGVVGRNNGQLRESAFGTAGVFGDGGAGDGVVGIGNNSGKSGVFGNSQNGTGVAGHSHIGLGVAGSSDENDGVFGGAAAFNKSGVVGLNTATVPPLTNFKVFGVTGKADSASGIGVFGDSQQGIGVLGVGGLFGGEFQGGRAPLRLIPAATVGAPASGAHVSGEFYVDSQGDLFFCKTDGTPGVWKKVQLA